MRLAALSVSFVVWLLGVVSSHTLGRFIHLLHSLGAFIHIFAILVVLALIDQVLARVFEPFDLRHALVGLMPQFQPKGQTRQAE